MNQPRHKNKDVAHAALTLTHKQSHKAEIDTRRVCGEASAWHTTHNTHACKLDISTSTYKCIHKQTFAKAVKWRPVQTLMAKRGVRSLVTHYPLTTSLFYSFTFCFW